MDNSFHFDKKTLIGWAIIILIPMLQSGIGNKNDKDKAAYENYKLDAIQDQKILVLQQNEVVLFNKINSIETNTSETHDNMIILMIKNGLEPVLISNKKNNK